MKLNSLKQQLKPKALEGGISEFYESLKKQYKDIQQEQLIYIKETSCVLGCMDIVRNLIKILSMQPGALSNTKPKIFAPTPLNIAILEFIVSKEELDWNIRVKNVRTDMNAKKAVTMYNINRGLKYLITYDVNVKENMLETYINYITREIEFLDKVIKNLGGEKSISIIELNEELPTSLKNDSLKRKKTVNKALNTVKPIKGYQSLIGEFSNLPSIEDYQSLTNDNSNLPTFQDINDEEVNLPF
jgi:hypothetical protein